jgi:hypothetical protein
MKFERPENLAFPTIYYTFKAKDKNSDEIIEYKIQDVPEDFYEKAIDFFIEQFIGEENFCVAKKISERPVGRQELCDIWRETFKRKFSIACFRSDGSDEIVALNVLDVFSRNDPKPDVDVS